MLNTSGTQLLVIPAQAGTQDVFPKLQMDFCFGLYTPLGSAEGITMVLQGRDTEG